MTMSNKVIPGSDHAGRLAVECWCEQNIVWLAPELVRKGLTGACTRRECREMAKAAAA